jgi:hypothetical protein
MSGRVSYLGGIVKDGLILDLDAGKLDSYNRLGTTWNDISGNRNNGTLTNFGSQTIWNPNNLGSIVFDGTNDYVNCGTVGSLGSNPASSFSVSAWVKKNADGMYAIFEKFQGVTIVGIWGWQVRFEPPNDVLLYLNRSQVSQSLIYATNAAPINKWINVTFTYDGSFGYLYIDGIFKSSGATVGGTTSTRNFNLGILTVNNTLPLNGNISNVLAYTKTLSASEVLQNYNALKARFV